MNYRNFGNSPILLSESDLSRGIDTEDKKARMAYQMQRLVEGMGSAGALGSKEERLLEQVNAFMALRPTSQWIERYCQGVEATRKSI